MLRRTLLTAALAAAVFCAPLRAQEPADWVDPFVGTTNFGTTNPGAVCPNGMMSVVPFNVMGSDENVYDKDARWWSAPYEFHNKFFTGFAHVTLSGVGCPELGSLLVMPTTGALDVDYRNYGSKYTGETASPGYYSNRLSKYGVLAEVTATPRSSAERYTFPAGESHILLNLGEGLTNESGAWVRRVSDTEVEGMKLLGTFCYNPQAVFPIYFVMRVSKRPSATGFWKKQPPKYGVEAEWDKDAGNYKLYTHYDRELAGDDVGVWFSYETTEGEQLEVRMGVSFVSVENARLNLEAEQQERSFDDIRAAARRSWNDDLGRIRVEGGTDAQKKVFYTGLYHALIHPNVLSDVNGEYPAMESAEIRTATGFWKKQPPKYGVEAEWDKDAGNYKLYTHYDRELAGDDVGVWFSYETTEGEQLEVRMGVSFVSVENARLNLEAEQQERSFDDIRAAARRSWNDDLGRIRVEGGTDAQKKVFYTGLYHALIHPNVLSDVNGEYPAMESAEIRTAEGNRYTVFSLWDTYRNLHQLMTLVYPERQLEMVRSMIGMYKEWGWLPKWELYGRETFTMEGDPAIPVIVDTWMKGLRDFDMNAAYEAMRKSATTPGAQNRMRPDIDPYVEKGYVPLGFYARDLSGDNSVSHALEYYIADHALSLLADSLGRREDAALFRNRSFGYKNYYSPESGTFRPITGEGGFLTPFDPRQGENFEPVPGFHEGSAWNYTFYVPHDVYGLSKLMGGRRKFIDKLQMVFDEGLYDPANEPDIAYPYLFSYFRGEEWRTQREVNRLLAKYFTTAPDGIPGNDDTGTMSAWAVFSMMGFYPDCPGEPYYTLTSPVFDRVTVTLDRKYYPAGELVIETKRPDSGAVYIRSMTLGGKPLKRYRIGHDELLRGGRLTFELQNRK